jgi:uncharacterized membrane protein YfcA
MFPAAVSLGILVALIFVLAGGVKGVIGLGLPTVAMGLLALLMAPAEAAAILLVPSFVTNVWQLAEGPRLLPLLTRLWPMLAAVFLSTFIASGVISGGESVLASAGLGLALLVYALAGLFHLRVDVPARAEAWAGPLVGAATGLVTGATGVFVIPAVPYLAGLGFQRDELVQALGLSFTVSTVALAAGLLWHGALETDAAWISLGAVVPALAGMMLGGWIRRRIAPERFRRWFFAGLAVLGLQNIWSALS